MVENILRVYNDASPEDVLDGMEWYPKALNTCRRLAELTSYDEQQIAGVMAIMSPGMVWDENETAPGRVLDLHMNGVPATEWSGFSTYPHNLFKAESVLNGDLTAVKGSKVTNFYLNILGYDRYVTVDRWACRIALANPKLPGKYSVPSGEKAYNKIADAYKAAAGIADLPNSMVQAITWVSYRRQHYGRASKIVERVLTTEPVEVLVHA